MKNLFLFSILLLAISCNQPTTETPESLPPAIKEINMDWLLGSWNRVGEEEGRITHEYWEKISDTEYKGLGCTLVGKDTVSQENMRLIKKDDTWSCEVSIKDNPEVVAFLFTELTEGSFTCENEANDFPKKIEYFKGDNQLKAKISGGGPDIPFEFVRMK